MPATRPARFTEEPVIVWVVVAGVVVTVYDVVAEVGVNVTVADVRVMLLTARLVTSLHTGGGVVAKLTVAVVAVALAAQLAAMLTV